MMTALIEQSMQTKGDLPGHPFRGNQWTDGQGGSFAGHDVYDPSTEPYTHATRSQHVESIMKEGLRKSDGIYGKAIYLGVGEDVVNTGRQFADTLLHVRMKEGSRAVEAIGMRDFYKLAEAAGAPDDTDDPGSYFVKAGIDAVRVKKPDGDFMVVFNQDSIAKISVEPIKSRLSILHKTLEIATAAVRLKQMLLKDQLRNAVVKAVHVKQYEETEKELAEAVAELIKRQFADAGRKLGRTKDELELIEKGDLPGHPFRGNQWSGGQSGDVLDKLSENHRRVFFDEMGYNEDDFNELVTAIRSGDKNTVDLYDENIVPAVRAAVRKADKTSDKPTKENENNTKHSGKPNPKLPDESRPDLTKNEIDVVREYLAEGTPYYNVNQDLRSGGRLTDTTLQDAIGKAREFKSPVDARRGIEVDDIEDFAGQFSVGGEWTDRGFFSASASGKPFPGNVQFKVGVRRGLDASFYGDNSGEILLPAGSSFRVLSVRKQNGRLEVELDQIVGNQKSPSFTSTKTPSQDIFDPRDWDSELTDTCLPILMRKAGEAAAAQMLIMGVDVAPRKKVGRTEKGDLPGHPFRGNQWEGRESGVTANWGDKYDAEEDADKRNRIYDAWRDEMTKVLSSIPHSDRWSDPEIDVDTWSTYIKWTDEEAEESVFARLSDHAGWPNGASLTDKVVCLNLGKRDGKHDDPDGEKAIEKLMAWLSDNKKSPSFTSTKTTATDWLLDNADAEDLRFLWPEVFTLPSGAVIDMGFATEWPAWMKAEISNQMKECFAQPFWAGINDTTAKGIQAHVQRGLDEGLSIREIRDQMVGDGLDEYYRNRGINIARTESGNALNSARSSAMDRLMDEVPGLKVKRTWMSVLGTTTRRTHANLDGVPADRDGMWYLGGVHVPWPGHWNLPPAERCNCFPAGVAVSGKFNGAQRGWYKGVIAKVVMRMTGTISMTVNHPVVTARGLVPAGMLKPGDKVLTYGRQADGLLLGSLSVGHSLPSSDQVDHKPPLIEDVFQAFAMWSVATASPIEIRRAEMGDFYGDGESLDGDIDIIRADWNLLQDGEVGNLKKSGNTIFIRMLPGLSSELALSDLGLGRLGLRNSCGGSPCVGQEPLGQFTPIGSCSPTGFLCLGIASDFDVCISETPENEGDVLSDFPSKGLGCDPVNVPLGEIEVSEEPTPLGLRPFGLGVSDAVDGNSCISEISPECPEVAANFIREAANRFPGLVAFDEVVDVRKDSFGGHVYDLQSEYGCIIAHDPMFSYRGIVTKNCQCTIVQSWGMSDESASELIDEYNERLNEERSLRDALIEKGDLPGHPFRGNQWSGGRQGTSSTDSSFAMADDTQVLTGTLSQLAPVSRTVRAEDVVSSKPINGTTNGVSLVEIKEGDTVGRYVLKEADAECPYTWEKFRGRQCVAEAAASAVAEELGLYDLVAETEMASVGGRKGALQKYVNDTAETASKRLGDREVPTEADLERLRSVKGVDEMLYYDALIGNDDRHLKNWMVKDGRAVLIDNGRAFARNDEYDDFDRSWFRTMEHDPDYRATRSMPEKFRTGLDGMLRHRKTVDARLKSIGLEDAQRAAFWKRAEHLQKVGRGEDVLIFSEITLMDVARMSEGQKLVEGKSVKGDLPGHPFRGNQWGQGMMAPDTGGSFGDSVDDEYGIENQGNENRKKAKWKTKKGIAQGQAGTAGKFEFEAKVRVWEQTEDPYTYSAEAVHVRNDGKWMRSTGDSDEAQAKAVKQAMAELGYKLWFDNPKDWKEGKSPIDGEID